MGAIDYIKQMITRESSAPSRSYSKIFSLATNTAEVGRMSQGNMEKYLSKYADQAWIYSCIKIIQSKGAGVPLKIYQRDGEELTELPEHPLRKLLESVNPFMNGYDLLESTHGYIELVGNAYWLLDSIIDGKPTEIYPLNPKCIKIIADKKRNIVGYAYELTPGIVDQTFSPEEIVHFKTWNPLDPYYGMAPICAARDSSDTMYFSDQYNKAFFKNGGQPGGILTTDQGIDEDSKRRIDSAWTKRHGKPHKLAILDNGLKYQSMSETHQDMQFGELKKMSREDVLTVFNMPPIMVGLYDEANYSNAREQRRIFWVDCMIPRLRKIESVINERLVKAWDPSLIAKHDLSGVEDLAEDLDKRSRADGFNVSAGITTVNEVRKSRNLPDVPWGNTWWAPMGVSPVNPVTGRPDVPETPDPSPSPTNTPSDSEDEPVSDPEDSPNDSASKSSKSIEDAPSRPVNDTPSASDQQPTTVEDPKKIKRDQVWTRYKGLTEQIESRWAGVLRRLFTDQEREVIANLEDSDWKKMVNQNRLDKMRNVKQSIDLILFDRTKSRTIFRKDAHSLMTYTVRKAAEAEIEQYGLGIDFNLTDPNISSWINSKAFKFADEVNRTTEDALREALVEAINNGETITQVEDRIAQIFDIARGSRTAMIARTEVISASNAGAMESYKQSGVVDSTEWVSSRDARVRDEHQIDGEVAKLGANFSNGLKYPGDPSGEPGNVINCRCTVAPITKEGD